ncbi:MAG: succinyl-CoA--3-ketoacid-CoA transferase [Chloroflexi bacterium]|nr:succinyl-CoA--3-ketoacid-CoA transferase [Chloroflexota bacterium]
MQNESEQLLAMRIVKELKPGECVNLGIGMGTLVGAFVPDDSEISLHAEVGVIGHGHVLDETEWDKMDFDLLCAGVFFVAPKAGMSFCDYAEVFDAVRIGRVDVAILGAYEVSESGDLANWAIDPHKPGAAIGGAMDIAAGARKVIVGMKHTTKDGKPKLVKECTLPLTAKGVVKTVITELAVIDIVDRRLVVREIAPGWSLEELQRVTEPELIPAPDLRAMTL